jgi:RNA polymerase sigma factor (sigma-70 family)
MKPYPSPEQVRVMIAALAADPTSEAAWCDIYQYLRPIGSAAASRFLRGQSSTIDDVLQEAFTVLIVRGIPRKASENPAYLGPFFHRVVTNICHDLHRGEKRAAEAGFDEAQRLDLDAFDIAAFSDGGRGPGSLSDVDIAILLEFLAKDLTTSDRQLLELIMEGHSTAEIATRLQLRYSTAGVRIHRLRQRLCLALELDDC